MKAGLFDLTKKDSISYIFCCFQYFNELGMDEWGDAAAGFRFILCVVQWLN